jgi:hypothetical protein
MRQIVMAAVLGVGSLLLAAGPARAQDATTSTMVNVSSYDDDWYDAYYCWIVARYGNNWNLDSSNDCGRSRAGTTSTSVTPPAPAVDVVASLLTTTSAPVRANANSWVTLNWTVIGGHADVFHVTATADKGVSATYPESTRSYASLYRDDHLANLELDYTALKLTVPAGVTGNVTISLHMTYQTALRENDRNYTVTVPVVAS